MIAPWNDSSHLVVGAMKVWIPDEAAGLFHRQAAATRYDAPAAASGDPALLHLVQQRLVAHLQVGGGLAAVPPEAGERLVDGIAFGFHRRRARQVVKADAVGLERRRRRVAVGRRRCRRPASPPRWRRQGAGGGAAPSPAPRPARRGRPRRGGGWAACATSCRTSSGAATRPAARPAASSCSRARGCCPARGRRCSASSRPRADPDAGPPVDRRILATGRTRPAARISSRRSRSGGIVQLDDLQAVVEILAEGAAPHHRVEVAVGGGDDAHVDLDGAVAAQPRQLAAPAARAAAWPGAPSGISPISSSKTVPPWANSKRADPRSCRRR